MLLEDGLGEEDKLQEVKVEFDGCRQPGVGAYWVEEWVVAVGEG